MLYDTCNPTLIVSERAALKQAGVPSSKVIYYNLGCPAGQVFTQAILQPAVLSFKNAGVTAVTSAQAGTSAAIFTQVAGQQTTSPNTSCPATRLRFRTPRVQTRRTTPTSMAPST